MKPLILRFLADEVATTAIEYVMIAAGIAAAIVGAVNLLGTQVNGLYSNVANAMH